MLPYLPHQASIHERLEQRKGWSMLSVLEVGAVAPEQPTPAIWRVVQEGELVVMLLDTLTCLLLRLLWSAQVALVV
ncbi:hypothetical protein RNH54_005664 [Raoultella planticola]|nr:hypothetical protein [Raoultella planticola]